MTFASNLVQHQARSESYNESAAITVHIIPPAISILFYGLYLPLSLVCIPMVYRRKRSGYKAHLGALLLLIMASTASLIVQCVHQGKAFWNMEMELIEGGPEDMANIIVDTMESALIHDFTVLGIYIFSNVIADALLIYRCYLIWDKDRRVMSLPVLGYVSNIILGIMGLAYQSKRFVFGFWIIAVIENVTLTLLTAGKIWYINNEAGGILGSAVKTKYNTIAAIILESGCVYSSIVLATSITSMTPVNAVYASCLMAAATQFVGIGPSLIILRVALGVDTRNVLSSLAIMSNPTHTRTRTRTGTQITSRHNNDKHTGQGVHNPNSEELLDTDALLWPDTEDTDVEAVQRIKTVTRRGSRGREQHRYASLGDDDSSETTENTPGMLSTETTPGPTPNAQMVEFARSDLAFVGSMIDMPRSESPVAVASLRVGEAGERESSEAGH